jgi:hypothetical protein
MDLRFRALRFLCRLLLPLSCVAVVLVSPVIVNSFRMPPVALGDLYRWSATSTPIGIGTIFVGIALGFFLLWLSEPFIGVNTKADAALKQPPWAGKFIHTATLALALTCIIPNFRYVHPEGSRWIATGKRKPVEIPAELARIYMWRNIRMDAVFVFVTVFNIGTFCWSRLAGISQVLDFGEELIPKIKEHIRPRDWRPPGTPKCW